MTENEIYTVGEERVAVTIIRKTKGDLLVARDTTERWFSSEAAAAAALRRMMNVLVEAETELLADGDDLARRRERAGHKDKSEGMDKSA